MKQWDLVNQAYRVPQQIAQLADANLMWLNRIKQINRERTGQLAMNDDLGIKRQTPLPLFEPLTNEELHKYVPYVPRESIAAIIREDLTRRIQAHSANASMWVHDKRAAALALLRELNPDCPRKELVTHWNRLKGKGIAAVATFFRQAGDAMEDQPPPKFKLLYRETILLTMIEGALQQQQVQMQDCSTKVAWLEPYQEHNKQDFIRGVFESSDIMKISYEGKMIMEAFDAEEERREKNAKGGLGRSPKPGNRKRGVKSKKAAVAKSSLRRKK